MGFKFRKSRRSIKILPGIRLNTGKKGITSVSIGSQGKYFSSTLNINNKGVKNSFTINGIGTFTSTPTRNPKPHYTPLSLLHILPRPQVSTPIQSELPIATLWDAACQGDTKALECLITFEINTQGLESRVTNSAALLRILIRGEAAPDRVLAESIKELVDTIQPQGYTKAIITAKSIRGGGTWSEEWDLNSAVVDLQDSTSEFSLELESLITTEARIDSLSTRSPKLASSTSAPISRATMLQRYGLLLGVGLSLLLILFIVNAIASK